MKIVVCTHNLGKLNEFKEIFKELNIKNVELISISDLNKEIEEPDEDKDTFEGNADLKAEYYFNKVNLPVIADDSGLVVDVLNGEPGVFSARYNTFDNPNNLSIVDKLLFKMKNIENRDAHFECLLCFKNKDIKLCSDGVLDGKISLRQKGENGFGYDPIFIPDGSDLTLAEMSEVDKNKISHRRRAIENMIKKLSDNRLI